MYTANRGTRERATHRAQWLTADRIVPYSCIMLMLFAALATVWGIVTNGFTSNATVRPAVDFSVFWTASHLVLHGHAAAAYDPSSFMQAELAQFDAYLQHRPLPWLYPPTMLLFVAPVALVPFLPAYFLFFAGSLLCYAFAVSRLSGLRAHLPVPRAAALVVVAYSAVCMAALFGQNSILTAGIAALALHLLGRRPIVAGLLIGLLAIKPQLAVVFPFVLVAARAWRTFAAAALSATLFAAAGIALAGPGALHGLSLALSTVRDQHFMLPSYWLASPTPFAALRLAGAPVSAALAAQAAVALLALAAAVDVWRRTRDMRLRGAVLAVATLLTTPYLWNYELTWLGIAIFCLIACGLDEGWLPGEQGILVLAWLLPIFEMFNRLMKLPQVGPLVLLAVLFVVVRRAALTSRSAR
ncbi:membrane protein [Burkholderia paludis]|uniref:glycosyltransferase family 87 protein n=1 Tax=Burkholderia paludis TaxID=1506587 RepID=UPI0004DB677D|nr:glycosyltransferase family 87 protein [Burkholderia paludis]KFG97917.1 membrane protein [Burkholderia paludis]